MASIQMERWVEVLANWRDAGMRREERGPEVVDQPAVRAYNRAALPPLY